MSSMVNYLQGLFDVDQEMGSQMGFVSFPPNMTMPPLVLPGGCHQSLITLTAMPSLLAADHHAPSSNPAGNILLSSATLLKQRAEEDLASYHHLPAGPPKLSSQKSTGANLWAWGEMNECMMSNKRISNGGDDRLGLSALKMKKLKGRRKVREPRFCFKTMSDVDVLDDGYKWRKYGQKVVKNTQHPRSYYRCTQDNCRVKKRVERLAEDPRMVITTYEGRHVHYPSNDNDDDDNSQASNSQLINTFCW
ncbi:probable WRKY transcription factor 13 [Diospyros lotus]|uniref:probable WRKY transcription factor 13 n=1 Tax=Diospyros lotus TaxID=55363 RepID=UPI002253B668|nr:probable WRKY transcription factor 13 [Diospyros lotus]